MSADPLQPLAVGASEAERILGFGSRKLWSLTASGEIPHVRVGRRVLYRVEALREWLAERERRRS